MIVLIFFLCSVLAPHNREVILKLVRYSIVMFTFPIGVFFLFHHFVFMQDKDSLKWSGMAAVVAANTVIAAYVRMAWQEDRDQNSTKRSINKTD